MKRFLLCLLLFACLNILQVKAVYFMPVGKEKEWEEVLFRAKWQERLIFLEFHSSTCPPCVELDINTFSDLALSVYMNKVFVNARVDAESDFGMNLLEAYDVQNLPAMFILDAAGHSISGQIIGYHSPEKIIGVGQRYVDLYEQFLGLKETFYNKELKDESIILKYAYMLDYLNYTEEGRIVADMYFINNTAFNYIPEEWLLIQTYIMDLEDPVLHRFFGDIDAFKTVYNPLNVDLYLNEVFKVNFFEAVFVKDTNLLNKLVYMLAYFSFPDSFFGMKPPRLYDYVYIAYFEQTQMWDEYAKRVVSHVERFDVPDTDYREFIVRFYLHIEEDKMTKLAGTWARKLYRKEKVFSNIILHALMQEKSGKIKRALRLLDKAGKGAVDDEQRAMVVQLSQQFSEKLK